MDGCGLIRMCDGLGVRRCSGSFVPMNSVFDLNCRRRELKVKLTYAYARYIESEKAKEEAMGDMAKAEGELMNIEFEIQKAAAEESMAASDRAWDLKRIREWTNSL